MAYIFLRHCMIQNALSDSLSGYRITGWNEFSHHNFQCCYCQVLLFHWLELVFSLNKIFFHFWGTFFYYFFDFFSTVFFSVLSAKKKIQSLVSLSSFSYLLSPIFYISKFIFYFWYLSTFSSNAYSDFVLLLLQKF